MACKWEVWGKREKGENRRTQDKAEREKESLKVRVLGFKNAYRLERVSCIRLEKKIEISKIENKIKEMPMWRTVGTSKASVIYILII